MPKKKKNSMYETIGDKEAKEVLKILNKHIKEQLAKLIKEKKKKKK